MFKRSFISLLSLVIITSCASLNSAQDKELKTWQAKNLEVREKNPSMAAGLNVLPGIGDFYNGNVGLGVVNLLLWPASVLWAPVGGADGAKEVNYYATKAYVDELENNKKKVKGELESAYMLGQIDKKDYFVASKKLESMELIEFKNKLELHEILPKKFEKERLPASLK